MKKLFVLLMVLGFFVGGSGLAQAAFSWIDEPILGYDSVYDGNIVIITGSTPEKPGGGFYTGEDGQVVLGPTIPHYSGILPSSLDYPGSDPLAGVGSPSMTVFTVGQSVHTGSALYTDTSEFSWSAVFTGPTRTLSYNGSYDGTTYWMTWNTPDGGGDGSGISTLTAADVGNWTYVETYTNSTGVVLTSTRDFEVRPVPLPAAVWLLGTGLVGLFGVRRRFTS